MMLEKSQNEMLNREEGIAVGDNEGRISEKSSNGMSQGGCQNRRYHIVRHHGGDVATGGIAK